MKTTRYILVLTLALTCAAGNLYAAITSSYYSTIDGKSGSGLRDQLYTITSVGPQNMSYDKLWTAYQTTDVYPKGHANAGKIWDMYGNCTFTYSTNQCGTYSKECDCYNREHSLPKSWFAEEKPAYYDLGHIVPTDGKVNGMRSNFAFGEVSSATYTYAGSKLGSAKSITTTNTICGASVTATCSDKVFEPVDEYKGDFARMYMYMVVRYKSMNMAQKDGGAYMFNTEDTYYRFTKYTVALLMKWHRQDPVSQKEIDRNNGMQSVQGNRNPFIDYPCLAEYLWGDKAGETVTLSNLVGTFDGSWTTGDGCPCGTDPAITLPAGTEIVVGSTSANSSVTKTVTVQGVNLTGNISLALSGTNSSLFSINATTMLKAAAEAGSSLTITYKPTAAGNHTATLTISGGGLTSNKTYTLSGTCCNPYSVTLSRNGVTETTSACGTLTLPTAEEETDACSGWTFQGWLASGTSFTEGTSTKPTFVTSVSSTSTLHAVYGKGSGGNGSSSAAYVFTTSGWNATLNGNAANWTSGKAGGGYSNNGVQVTTGASGANATCPTSYSNVTSIVVSYCTNKSSGAGSIEMDVNGTKVSQSVSKTGGTAARDLNFDFSSTKPSGTPKITVTCTTNSIYICGVTINTGGAGSMTYKKLPCTTYTITLSGGGNATGGTFEASASSATAGTVITLDADPSEGYQLSGWTVTKAGGGTVTVTNNQFTMPEANVTVAATFSEQPKYNIRFYNNSTQIGSTQQVYAGSSPNVPADPEACDGYTFVGWWTSTLATDNTTAKTWVTDFTVSKAQDYYAVFSKTETTGGGGSTPSSAVYTFTTSGWNATLGGNAANWTSGKAGGGYINNGVQVTTTYTGANATCPTSYSNVTSIVVSYCTNSSKGAGTIVMNVNGTDVTQTVSTSGGTTARDLTFDFSSTKPSGAPKITVNCTTNSIYICGVTINYTTTGGGTSTTYYSTTTNCATPCTQLSKPNVTATAGDKQITLRWADVTDADHYTVTIGTGVGYTTECSSPSIGDISHSGTTNTCVITGLVNGLSYTTSVVANAASSSCDSEADQDTTTPDAEVTPGDATVNVDGEVDASDLNLGIETHLTIAAGGHLTVSEPVAIDALTLQYTETGHAQITGIDNLTSAALDVVVQLPTPASGSIKYHWFAIAVPFEVNVSNGIYVGEGNTPAASGKQFYIDEYDGAQRASTQNGWKRVPADGKLVPGKMYMLYVGAEGSWRFVAADPSAVSEVATISVAKNSSSAGDRHSGWNGVANTKWSNAAAALDGISFITLYNNQSGAYSTQIISAQTLPAATPFFVQAAADGTINLSASSASPAPWRAASASDITVIELTDEAESYTDRAYLTVVESKQDQYMIGHDLEKMSAGTATVPQLWLEAYDMQLAAHEAPLGDEARIVPLGMYAPEEGMYTLAVLDVPAYLSIELTKDGQTVWDLTGKAVSLSLRAGDNEGYGLRINRVSEVVTGVDAAEVVDGVRKVLIDGQLLIMRGGKTFTVTGVRVQ